MKTNLFKNVLRSTLVTMGLLAAGAVHAYTLPAVSPCNFNQIDPSIPSNLLCATDPGTGAKIYVGSSHDDFISYGVNNLNFFANFDNKAYTSLSDWSSLASYGSGQIIKLFTFNNANNTIDKVTYPDATLGTGDNNTGLDADQTPTKDNNYLGEYPYNGSFSIQMLKDYLAGTGTSPVFGFDFNGDTMQMTGYLQVKAADGSVKKTWSFDNATNNQYDSDAANRVTALKEQFVFWQDPVRCANEPGGLCFDTVINSDGSGKADFLGYAPDFNVNDWDDTDTLAFHWEMWGLKKGGEELTLTAGVNTPNDVPEPTMAFLIGAALLGLGVVRRKTN